MGSALYAMVDVNLRISAEIPGLRDTKTLLKAADMLPSMLCCCLAFFPVVDCSTSGLRSMLLFAAPFVIFKEEAAHPYLGNSVRKGGD